MTTVYLARVPTEDGLRWVMFDEQRTLHGQRGETRAALRQRWIEGGGKTEAITRYSGLMRPSELACTISILQHPVQRES
jgi:hypothetical protein